MDVDTNLSNSQEHRIEVAALPDPIIGQRLLRLPKPMSLAPDYDCASFLRGSDGAAGKQ